MKAVEMLSKKSEELMKERDDLQRKLADLYTDLRIKDVKNVRQLRQLKKDIARVNTVLNIQQLEAKS